MNQCNNIGLFGLNNVSKMQKMKMNFNGVNNMLLIQSLIFYKLA